MTALFLPEAEEEFREAARYYENECPGLGLTFITAVHKAISWIMETPMAATPVDSGIRSKVVGRFPYSVLYAVEGGYACYYCCSTSETSSGLLEKSG
jgi:hypothetical protein